MKITDKELIERTKPLIEKIVRYHTPNEGEKPEISEIFGTESGKLFGSQADQLLDFGMRGQIISLMPRLLDYIKLAAKTVTSDEYTNLVESQVDKDELIRFQNVQSFIHDASLENLDELELVLPKGDRLWYISLISFAMHTYLDVYSRSIINMVNNDSQLSNDLENYLVQLAQKTRKDIRNPVLKVSEMTRFGVEKRFKEIERGLGLDKRLEEIIGSEELDSWRTAFSEFQEIRHKIAHRNPKPELSEYTYESLEKDLEKVKLDFEDLDISPTVSHLLKDEIELLKGVFYELSQYVKKTTVVIGMASLYPALLDVVLSVKVNCEKD